MFKHIRRFAWFLLALFMIAQGWSQQIEPRGVVTEQLFEFTEDFSDMTYLEGSQTNANWSIEEKVVLLQWRDHVGAGRVQWPTNGGTVGTDTDLTFSIALGDVDGDGDLDVVAGNDGQANKVYLNDGDGAPFDSLGAGSTVGTDTDFTFSIALDDVDGDGDLDVVAGNDGQGNKVYLNDGDSAPFNSVGAGSTVGTDTDYTRSIALGDVDGDGDLDVVAGNANQRNLLYLNRAYNTGQGIVTSTKLNGDGILRIMLTVNEETNTPTTRNTNLQYLVTNNDGAKWYLIEPGEPFDFPTLGYEIRWRAQLTSLSGIQSPRLNSVTLTEMPVSITIAGVNEIRDTFDSLDSDFDGFLTFEESNLATIAEFYSYDENNDGVISEQDLLNLLSDLYGAALIYLDNKYNRNISKI